jgi:hypothetical protein
MITHRISALIVGVAHLRRHTVYIDHRVVFLSALAVSATVAISRQSHSDFAGFFFFIYHLRNQLPRQAFFTPWIDGGEKMSRSSAITPPPLRG